MIYRIEIKQEIITPITVTANNEGDAKVLALSGSGELGQSYPSELEIKSIRVLNHE